jgi:hypothetical protein
MQQSFLYVASDAWLVGYDAQLKYSLTGYHAESANHVKLVLQVLIFGGFGMLFLVTSQVWRRCISYLPTS